MAHPVEAVGFWLAVLLPLVYLPVLLLGLPTTWGLPAFLALIALHPVALAAGRTYGR